MATRRAKIYKKIIIVHFKEKYENILSALNLTLFKQIIALSRFFLKNISAGHFDIRDGNPRKTDTQTLITFPYPREIKDKIFSKKNK